MITLITGTPGAGKTLYTVANLLRELVGSSVQSVDDKGNPVSVPRTLYTNIPGLLLEHEVIDGRDGGGLADWHKWAKPGAVICFDEVQKEWGVRPNGSKVPDQITALETHRHMGVDFIVITQGPQLIDQNLRALVGRHLHVRRMPAVLGSIVYEWDHCSRQLLYTKSLAKKAFRYPKDVFKLYKSSELHTKPKVSPPGAIWVTGAALAGAAFLVPYIQGRMENHGKPKETVSEAAVKPDSAAPLAQPVTKPTARHIPVPVMPRDVVAIMPPAPIPLDHLDYGGTMVTQSETLHLFRNPRGGIITSRGLIAQGYKVQSDDASAVTVRYGNDHRTFFAVFGGSVPGRNVPPPSADVSQALQRLVKSNPAQILPGHKAQPWNSDGMAYARRSGA